VRSIVVVGASLAGLRAAEALREAGFDGAITVVGDEPHLPYDRPPLSKQVLAGDWDLDRVALTGAGVGGGPDLRLDWRLGERAVALDVAARSVSLASGERLGFDGLVVATGATPRTLPGTAGLAGVHLLRTVDDCLALRADLDRTPRRVVVVGAGFIGAEVAATCRGRGLEVTLLEALPVPLGRVFGPELGTVFADLHRDHGVDVRLGAGVAGIDGQGRVERVRLRDGGALDADVVVVGIGVVPNTDWLEGSGLTVADGVQCDQTCLAAPGVVAAGDVARWPNPRFGQVMRVEHWENAVTQGQHAGRRLVAGDEAAPPYAPVPWFWSDQYDRKIQLAGVCAPGDQVEVVEGSLAERRFVAFFGRAGRLVGVLGFNRPRPVMQYRNLIAEGATVEHALAIAREG
jgi:3-phenylpropionate/trans-cinnamate dioxygenase ferredoxin reductase subunit